jgi:hypothetical protein
MRFLFKAVGILLILNTVMYAEELWNVADSDHFIIPDGKLAENQKEFLIKIRDLALKNKFEPAKLPEDLKWASYRSTSVSDFEIEFIGSFDKEAGFRFFADLLKLISSTNISKFRIVIYKELIEVKTGKNTTNYVRESPIFSLTVGSAD